jgi:zinc transporter ZupT
MSLFEHVLLISSILLVGIIALGFIGKIKKLSKLWLAFSGAFLVSITFLHLFPIIYQSTDNIIGIWVLVGFFGQLFLEQFSSGIEHGHMHAHDKRSNVVLIVQVMIGLIIHSFAEGLSLGGFESHSHEHHASHFFVEGINPLLIGIILHHAPAAFALMMVLSSSKVSKFAMLACLVVFAITPSIGAMTMLKIDFNQEFVHKILAFVSGSFLHVATTILFETDNADHKVPYQNLIASMLGALLSLLTI